MSKSGDIYRTQRIHAIFVLVVMCFVQPVYGLETTGTPATKRIHRTLFDHQLGRFDLQTDRKPNPIFDDLSDEEKWHLEELWKAVLKAPTATKLKQLTNISLYGFEKAYWRIFDHEILRKNSWSSTAGMGTSLTEPSLEPDYPRYGEQSAPYAFGKFSRRGSLGSGAEIGAGVGLLGGSLNNRHQLSQGITEVLEKLVTNYRLYKYHLKDVEDSAHEASRRELVDLAGEKAVSEMETLLRERKI